MADRLVLGTVVSMADPDLPTRVTTEVELWTRWVPGWKIGSYRTRARICRRCFNSPIARAAGLDQDVPHQVRHALVSRMQKIIDRSVEEFTEASLPNLWREIASDSPAPPSNGYHPHEGLDPEYEGIELDPIPDPGQSFLFTLESLAEKRPERSSPPPAPLSDEQKAVLRSEVALADECARITGQRVCEALREHAPRIKHAITTCVEPQVRAVLSELSHSLESP
ncbi:spermidine/putrescine ABC transporter substrate-binding protein [Lysinibacter sp. HNR]|uniref:spermidine/putrescine ABC transporter substrate-binding protein n=1 Tax=Lysinibacter sp. HNR TaxID=3031408 RepID=UPI0024348E43|nr:spermidine/putrescine ABC transporter substrate-binding protein [Lysinibacter sp. HNR]WGD36761.1 spermidine/putrescine ABC transporter substrate-binding protein [Lysinibacter sp. HNR]